MALVKTAPRLQRHRALLRSLERYVGITGSAEGLEHLPDGDSAPVPLTCQETLFAIALRKSSPHRHAARSQSDQAHQRPRPLPLLRPCERGCMTHSYSTPPHYVADASGPANCTHFERHVTNS